MMKSQVPSVAYRRFARNARIVLFGAALNLILTVGAASAQYPGGTPPPEVRGREFFPGNEGTAKTGQDILLFIAIALLALVIGYALRRYARRTGSRAS